MGLVQRHWHTSDTRDPSPFLLSFFPFPLLSPSPFSFPPLIQLGGLGKLPTEPRWSPATKCILVQFEVKVKHFRVLMSCIVSTASYCTAKDLFHDGISRTINYVDENSVLYT